VGEEVVGAGGNGEGRRESNQPTARTNKLPEAKGRRKIHCSLQLQARETDVDAGSFSRAGHPTDLNGRPGCVHRPAALAGEEDQRPTHPCRARAPTSVCLVVFLLLQQKMGTNNLARTVPQHVHQLLRGNEFIQ
jgi:hypothetical protein